MRTLRTCCYLIVTCVLVTVAWAQDPGTGGATATSGTNDISTPVPNAGQLSDPSGVKQLGKANSLGSNFGLMHWGPLSLGSTEIFQAYASADNGASSLLTEVTANLAAEHRFGRNHLVFQYSPKLTVADGQFLRNFSDQDSRVDTFHSLTPRLGLSLSDHFQTLNATNLDGSSFFSADTISSTSEQHAFLQGSAASQFLTNSAQASLSYSLSATTHVSASPTYSFSKATGITNPLLSHAYGVSVNVEHSLAATKSIGAFYGHQSIRVDDASGSLVTPYENIGLTYAQQLTPSWGINANLGAFREGLAEASRWSGSANVTVTKSFGRSSAALTFFRGQGIAGIITNNVANRVDLLYRYRLSRRLQLETTSGYASFTTIHAIYSTCNLDWAMQPNLSWFASYAYKYQQGDGNQIATVRTNFVRVGLRWHPRAAAY